MAEIGDKEIPLCTVRRGGQEVGVVGMTDGDIEAAIAALQAAGFECDCGQPSAAGSDAGAAEVVFREGSCSEDDHRACDLATAIGVASEVAKELDLPSNGSLSAIVERGATSEAEARTVLTQWASEVKSAPGADEDALGWADVVVSEVFSPEPETKE